MKKLILFALCVVALGACDNGEKKSMLTRNMQNDSLQQIINARDNEINDILATLNDVQTGLNEITAAEEHISLGQIGENGNRDSQLKENIAFIAERMKQNRELIDRLRTQLKESGFKGDQLQKTIDGLVAQLDKKETELKRLRTELAQKNVHIEELDRTITARNQTISSQRREIEDKSQTINERNQTISAQKQEIDTKQQTISNQAQQLNTAWYVFGTKRELKDHNILKSGKVLQNGFDPSYFTKIDIRVDKVINLHSKSAKLLTTHPSSSYTLNKDTNGQYVLRITNPEMFWSTSKYLVVQVK